MKRIVDTTEVLGTIGPGKDKLEVCAAAKARYDEAVQRLEVELTSFLRPVDNRDNGRLMGADWLPNPEKVSEPMTPEEAHDAAREIFRRWARKVRQAMPLQHSHTA